jgi:hypothetical protein
VSWLILKKDDVLRQHLISCTLRSAETRTPYWKEVSMQNLSPRHVKKDESTRLGVESGWYGTKVSGTFVTGPHATENDCLRKIADLNATAAQSLKAS